MSKAQLAVSGLALVTAVVAPTLLDAAPRRAASHPASAARPRVADALGGDVRCLLISRLLMQASDGTRQAMGVAGSLYFSARLQPRMSDSQIENALVADAQKAPPSPDQTKACGARLDARVQELDAIAKHVDARLDTLSPRRPANPPAATPNADPAPTPPDAPTQPAATPPK